MEIWPISVCNNRLVPQRKKKQKSNLLSSSPTSAKTKCNPFFEKGCGKDRIFAGPTRENSRRPGSLKRRLTEERESSSLMREEKKEKGGPDAMPVMPPTVNSGDRDSQRPLDVRDPFKC
ncbi:hypothetical protein LR48_Vigan09g051200 [Vigna angularis]|uniref:Uncharacterized protein n=1 Tax=Phaseolus angularis TaxID=3914 RepID=A0A0L9VA22_PHAAN|nr:hypothetical protein LR48_Vigan09g051200 [Vigna angularis]